MNGAESGIATIACIHVAAKTMWAAAVGEATQQYTVLLAHTCWDRPPTQGPSSLSGKHFPPAAKPY